MNGMMKKAGLAVALAATAFTASVPADAQRYGGGYRGGGYHGGYGGYHGGYGGYRGGYRGGNIAGAALLGGLVGVGVGAAIVGNRGYGYGYGPGPYYGPAYRGYYGAPYGYYGGPRCFVQGRYDPYYGRTVPVRVCR